MKRSNFEKWDVHHHIIPEFYKEELKIAGITDIFGFKQPKWTEDMQLRMMKKHNFTKVFMSISTPGVYFNGNDFSRRLARRCNEYMADIIYRNPEKFGGFAAVPLPDVEGAITELKYSLDELKLDGVGLLSNVNGNYLGKKEYREFFKELNDRNAVVFVHPTARPEKSDHRLLNYMYLFMLDTTRTMIDFIRSGYHRDYPNIKFILSHGGGVLPVVAPTIIKTMKEENPDIDTEFKNLKTRIYPDTARIAYHDTMKDTISFSGINHVVLGTDYIWAKNNYAYWIKLINSLDIKKSFIQDIFKNNAEKLFEFNEPIENIPLDSCNTSINQKNAGKIKYHYHCNPDSVIEAVKGIVNNFDEKQVKVWNPDDIYKLMNENGYERIMLSLDLPQIWNYESKICFPVIREYNKKVADIRDENPREIGAFGAVDVDDADHAIAEIDYCLNNLNLDGICIYTRIYNSELEDIFDLRILDKLAKSRVPVLVHPKDSRGIPIINENYLDSVYFIAKMLYLGNYDLLKKNEYVLTHTGGMVPFMAQNIGLLYYMQLNKTKAAEFIFDWIITKKLKGYEYLRDITVDDL